MQATTRFREAREPRATGATLATPVKAFPVPVSTSPRQRRVGLVLSALSVLFLLFDSVIKELRIAPVIESFAELGYPAGLERTVGTLELVCLLLYVWPRTSVLGAVLLSGYLGGAVATHLRAGSPLPTHTLFPLYVGALLWVGLLLRDARLRALVPLRRVERSIA